MGNCDWCGLSEEDRRFQVYESRSWAVFLSDEQDYIGRCILVLKRHCGSLPELTGDEWEELRFLVCKVEACLKTVLGATLCNWSCLMNSFYKGPEPDPHLHIHVRPRYEKAVMLNGNTYADSEFGHHYAVGKTGSIPAEDREELFIRLKERLDHGIPTIRGDRKGSARFPFRFRRRAFFSAAGPSGTISRSGMTDSRGLGPFLPAAVTGAE